MDCNLHHFYSDVVNSCFGIKSQNHNFKISKSSMKCSLKYQM